MYKVVTCGIESLQLHTSHATVYTELVLLCLARDYENFSKRLASNTAAVFNGGVKTITSYKF